MFSWSKCVTVAHCHELLSVGRDERSEEVDSAPEPGECVCYQLKEVEEEMVLKSGEIRVLRDCLKGAQQEKEAQRQKQVQLDAQRQSEHSDREKELNKKVRSSDTCRTSGGRKNTLMTRCLCSGSLSAVRVAV